MYCEAPILAQEAINNTQNHQGGDQAQAQAQERPVSTPQWMLGEFMGAVTDLSEFSKSDVA